MNMFFASTISAFVFFITVVSVASENISSSTTQDSLPIDTDKVYLGTGLNSLSTENSSTGIYYYFGYRLGNQLILGGSYTKAQGNKTSEGEGLSNIDQYYKDISSIKTSFADFNLTYFFKTIGYRESGWMIRGGIGTEWTGISGYFNRYGDDPGFFNMGNGLRVVEQGVVKELSFSRNYLRIEPAYQFVWPTKNNFIGGQIIELAVTAYVSENGEKTSYARADGKSVEIKSSASRSGYHISYALVF